MGRFVLLSMAAFPHHKSPWTIQGLIEWPFVSIGLSNLGMTLPSTSSLRLSISIHCTDSAQIKPTLYHGKKVDRLAFSKGDCYLASHDKLTLNVWCMESGTQIFESLAEFQISKLSFSEGNASLTAMTREEKFVFTWSPLTEPDEERPAYNTGERCSQEQFAVLGVRAASAEYCSNIQLSPVGPNSSRSSITGSPITAMYCHPSAGIVFCGKDDGSICTLMPMPLSVEFCCPEFLASI